MPRANSLSMLSTASLSTLKYPNMSRNELDERMRATLVRVNQIASSAEVGDRTERIVKMVTGRICR